MKAKYRRVARGALPKTNKTSPHENSAGRNHSAKPRPTEHVLINNNRVTDLEKFISELIQIG